MSDDIPSTREQVNFPQKNNREYQQRSVDYLRSRGYRHIFVRDESYFIFELLIDSFKA
ncbi:hypothetical protein [Alteromonas portus]|uniref:hypothetical protein n=1 Tax=Alteromonas portus TaxID=2565549 RepID=UPI001375D0E9|nr:hypothetical protein [Alteromonas portus]